MKYVSTIVAAATLAGALGGCADPYYPRYGYSQAYYYPSSYSYYPAPVTYTYYPARYPASYGYSSYGDYYRNYNGIHPGPERNFP